eukprot:1389644-Amphidinium_carterae.1
MARQSDLRSTSGDTGDYGGKSQPSVCRWQRGCNREGVQGRQLRSSSQKCPKIPKPVFLLRRACGCPSSTTPHTIRVPQKLTE